MRLTYTHVTVEWTTAWNAWLSGQSSQHERSSNDDAEQQVQFFNALLGAVGGRHGVMQAQGQRQISLFGEQPQQGQRQMSLFGEQPQSSQADASENHTPEPTSMNQRIISVLQQMPFIVTFHQRVLLLRKLIERDRQQYAGHGVCEFHIRSVWMV